MVPKRSLTEILTSQSEALLAESVPSEHAGDAPTNDKETFHIQKRTIESEIKQNEMKDLIKNTGKIYQMEVEHPQKLHPMISREVPGPSGIGSSLPSSQPSKLLVPNVPEHFKLPGPSGSTTAVSSVTVEEKVSQHTQEHFRNSIPRNRFFSRILSFWSLMVFWSNDFLTIDCLFLSTE